MAYSDNRFDQVTLGRTLSPEEQIAYKNAKAFNRRVALAARHVGHDEAKRIVESALFYERYAEANRA